MQTLETIPAHKPSALCVDLHAIQKNYKTLCQHLPSGQCAAVLKANAYGLGQAPIADALVDAGCRHFFYAYLDNALKARQQHPHHGITIYVLNGVFPRTESTFTDHHLIPCLISMDQVERWALWAKQQDKKLRCVIHIDTGLGREGLSMDEWATLQNHSLLTYLRVDFIMSHLANADDSSSAYNKIQQQRFKQLLMHAPTQQGSLANSHAIALGHDYHFDLARPGIALYGYCPALSLTPSIYAYARILSLKTLKKGESIGYNQTFRCQRSTRVALISIGHRDGLLRALSNNGFVSLNHFQAPILGRVSMDLMVVDITDYPVHAPQLYDWVLLYHDLTSTMAFAKHMGTSIYELLVRHGPRHHRCYLPYT